MDRISPQARSRNMAAVRSKHTSPELAVRRILHKAGYRYLLHDKRLPGTPDIVFPSRRAIIEVRGCFWHQHPGCPSAVIPATRQDYWQPKLEKNVTRDLENHAALRRQGWRITIVWECELEQDLSRVKRKLGRFLNYESVCPSSPSCGPMKRSPLK